MAALGTLGIFKTFSCGLLGESGLEKLRNCLKILMNNLKQQIFHIAESNSLNFEIPKCHLRYTGQEDSILFCYMGIIKEILETAYTLKGNSYQCEIVPIVTVDTVPIINSELYFNKACLCGLDTDYRENTFKIMALNLPHVSFYDIPLYMQYLYHEVYHYIAPADREKRDYDMGGFLTSIFYQEISGLLMQKSGIDSENSEIICNLVRPVIHYIISEHYEKVHNTLTGFERKDNDSACYISRVYMERLKSFLKSDAEEWYRGGESFLKSVMRLTDQYLEEGRILGLSYETLKAKLAGSKILGTELMKKCRENFSHCAENENASIYGAWIFAGLDDIINDLEQFYMGIMEVSADIPMIELSNMSWDEYFIFYVSCQKNLLIHPFSIEFCVDFKELMRLSMVMEYYQKKDGKFPSKLSEKLKNIFAAKSIAIHDEQDICRLPGKVQTLNTEIADWWQKITVECCNQSHPWYDCHRQMLDRILDNSSIANRLSNYNRHEKSRLYFTGYRQALSGYGNLLKKIMDMLDKGEEAASIILNYKEEIDGFSKKNI